ncbi:right-handed parallel beta-helix repeat-containing protein [Halomarina oriensis]|uniref:Right handed beta helix domain-containing protein n=1 Tax=Halomarina oriensis TaxID=671145 RepID=A0A6B0GRM2_9EURY|nr:right-handed parallel beta-helix repeat-containing protein [Halomarina oriensis]MWG34318.1 hypothetical protein [Halomarina oriensis]
MNDGLLGRVDRRQYLKLGAAAAAGAVGVSGATAAQTRDGVSFDRVVDAVDDLGMDPNGNEPIDSKLDRAWRSGTLIEFPAGDYLVTEQHGYFSDRNVGIVGKTGDRSDVQFVFPDGYDDRFLVVRFGGDWLFSDFTIQQSDDRNTGVGCTFAPNDGMTIRNVEIDGYNPRNKQRGLNIAVYDSGGEATIDGYVRVGESAVGNYPSGTQAMLVPTDHKGTLNIRNSRVENAGENGIYASRGSGDVRIENCYFANNDIASVRIAGGGSYVKNSTFVVDTDNTSNSGDYDNARGIWLESGAQDYSGGLVENCEFVLRSADNSGGLLRIAGSASDVTIRDSRFRNTTRFNTIYAEPGPGSITVENCSFTDDGTNPRQDYGSIGIDQRNGSTVSGCCIDTGGSRNGVVVMNASSCTVRRSTIDVGGRAVVSRGSSVATSGISNSGSCPLPSDSGSGAGGSAGGSSGGSDDEDTGDEDTDDGSSGDDGSSSDDGGSSNDGSDDESSDGGDDGRGDAPSGTRTLKLSSDSLSRYEFTVSGDLSFDDAFGTEDALSGSSSRGVLAGGTDKYEFSGEITSFTIEGSPTVLLDGQRVDPDSLGGGANGGSDGGSSGDSSFDDDGSSNDGSDDESSDGGSAGGDESDSGGSSGGTMHSLKLSDSAVSPYEFTVSGDVAFDPSFGSEDRIDGSTVSGVLAGGTDKYEFSGEITSFTTEGSPTVLLDGQRVDAASLGTGASGGSDGGSSGDSSSASDDGSADDSANESDDSGSSNDGSDDGGDEAQGSSSGGELANTVLLRSQDLAPYDIEVSGDIAFDPNWGTEDSVSDSSASGFLNGGGDAYRFSGEITSFEYEGDVEVRLNGEDVDPSSLGN